MIKIRLEMTTQELRKELIEIAEEDEELCSIHCKQCIVIDFKVNNHPRFKCLLDGEELQNIVNRRFLMSIRCQKCKDLFKTESK